MGRMGCRADSGRCGGASRILAKSYRIRNQAANWRIRNWACCCLDYPGIPQPVSRVGSIGYERVYNVDGDGRKMTLIPVDGTSTFFRFARQFCRSTWNRLRSRLEYPINARLSISEN